MSGFGNGGTLELFKVYRPKKFEAKAMWRYAIRVARYQVRCAQRQEQFREAGEKGNNLLAHARILVQQGALDGAQLEDFNDDYVPYLARTLRSLQATVGDLSEENESLRRMLKSLMTPLTKEGLVLKELELQDEVTEDQIDREIQALEREQAARETARLQALVEEDAASVGSEGSWRSRGSRSRRSADVDDVATDAEAEADAEAEEESRAEPDGEELNLHSPYESLLPPIKQSRESTASVSASSSCTGTKRRTSTSKGMGTSTSTNHFPSYLEREVMRKQRAAQTRNETILAKAAQLMREADLRDALDLSLPPLSPPHSRESGGGAGVRGRLVTSPTREQRAASAGGRGSEFEEKPHSVATDTVAAVVGVIARVREQCGTDAGKRLSKMERQLLSSPFAK
ncbi:hypothetical protein B484DRAFT_480643 [Ochromonadaceae sp. CCMP2298]|nr:hypothetical protein B484DRAFT_480643 [Ochromonadaceae sp. CCMP2298]|mmetsp:Transcript_3796/g.8578  ORF Transcript_3796/g.8578 Transcript_3796/m.8578 type:complete len:400 (-) Transcript_3796:163-1362(-)|eukprot:CAMPEP_0173263232 /NCGR_PEP_ID=MMETSP1142-20121109/27240_1 /TAXON_ID=483371 /ORGANISM="non described non described, Strain CCMP2298" /LENGTH=399 /DNA_ID=CAMNT_0014198507 /DNA_START=28 /DNA_END=1227 /DNA_ORIENTATION=+